MKKARALPPSFDAPEGEGEGEEEPDDDESIGEETEERLSGERGGGCREEESEEEGEEESEEEGEESESESKEEHTLESGDSDFWEHARNEALRSRTVHGRLRGHCVLRLPRPCATTALMCRCSLTRRASRPTRGGR